MTLSSLAPNKGARKRRKRLGKGEGSGNGKTCGRGQKGQKSRTGAPIPAGFEGGQMPLHRRLPKRGFTSRKRVKGENVFSTISIDSLQNLDFSGEVTLEQLRERGLIRSRAAKVKILGGGALEKKLVVEAHAASKSARAAIEAAGGAVRLVSR
ncbi:MAG: 50S ribosomal protein L15 [Bdellovibrionales bacterium]|nr:50S ribosomal protein L15 [Bdellovibrionales bacterium]